MHGKCDLKKEGSAWVYSSGEHSPGKVWQQEWEGASHAGLGKGKQWLLELRVLSPFIQSRTMVHGMGPPTFRMSLLTHYSL